MSNRVDFFQSSKNLHSLPCSSVSVFVDGSLCPYLEPLEIVRSGWPEYGWAKLGYNQSVYTDGEQIAIEDVETVLAIGRKISIRQIYNGLSPGAGAFSLPVFNGWIEGIERKISGKDEMVEIIAKDCSADFRRVTVYGQQTINADGESMFLAGLATAFNEDGKANAGIKAAENNGYSYTVFCNEPSKVKPWSYAEVIYYLLCEYLPKGKLQISDIKQLQTLTKNQIVHDLDVTGLSLLEVLYRCCERVGLKFKFVPRLTETGPEQALVFYSNGVGREIELNHQHAGEQLSISKTNIIKMHSRRNFCPVTHKYIGQGNFKVYEATFELVKAWDSSYESTSYNDFSPSTNPDFYKVRDVYRKWCLNESGDYSQSPYNQGDAYDFSRVFETESFTRHHRRFWGTLTTDKQGKSLRYFLEVSFDDGANWRQYAGAFDNLLDECGVWLSSDRLDIATWVAALKGVLKFRITASVVSDERLNCQVADGPVGSVAPVVEHVIARPKQFKYRKVSSQSIFANSNDSSIGKADEIDDSLGLYEYIRQMAGNSTEVIETVEVKTPTLVFDYRLADKVVTSPGSRDMTGIKTDNRSTFWIDKVQMDFEKQCTNLKIIRQRNLLL